MVEAKGEKAKLVGELIQACLPGCPHHAYLGVPTMPPSESGQGECIQASSRRCQMGLGGTEGYERSVHVCGPHWPLRGWN